MPSCQALVSQIAGITDEEEYKARVDYVVKHVDPSSAITRAGPSMNLQTAEKHVHGHIRKAKINLRDEWAEALAKSYDRLKQRVEKNIDLDDTMRMDRLPDHLQLLLLLANPATSETLSYASNLLERLRNPDAQPRGLTWAEILAEEPFEGEHWKGVYGLPKNAVIGGSEEDDSWDSDSSAWSSLAKESGEEDELSISSLADEEDREQRGGKKDADLDGKMEVAIPLRYDHRDKIEELHARQYWRAEWRPDIDLNRGFDIGDASTLGLTVYRVLGGEKPSSQIAGPSTEKYIYEHDAVREILMALQGRQNLLLSWTHQGGNTFSFTPVANIPRLAHLSLMAQLSLLSSFARTATTVHHLRKFISTIFMPGRTSLRALEAFAEALESEIRVFEAWCAAREEDMVRAQSGIGEEIVVSLLSLEKRLRDEFGKTYEVLLDVSRTAMRRATSRSATAARTEVEDEDEVWFLSELPHKQPRVVVAAFLLDNLFDAASTYTGMGDTLVPQSLLRAFARTAEPMWGMVRRWIEGGRSGEPLEEEFFVDDNELRLGDPDFWSEGYTLRDEGRRSVPVFLQRVQDLVLSAGKSVELLRAMGLDVDSSTEGGSGWRRFEMLLASEAEQAGAGVASVEILSQAVYDELFAPCRLAQRSLTRVLFDECELMRHLHSVEDLYLMMRGDDMTHFSNVLFGKASCPLLEYQMDTGQQWTDFHFLNTSFSDIINARAGKARWIDTALVRLAYRGTRAKNRTIRILEGLQMEYAVPFPLTYIFGPQAIRSYNSLFVFLLQLRRAKSVLDSILVFYAIRSKLSWFVNTMLNFVATYVLHIQVQQLHGSVQKAESLDEIIRLHEDHLEKVCGRCLLRDKTAALHRAVLSALDMSLYFSDCFVAFAGDSTHDISRASLIMTRRHRSRQQRRLRRNVIGFSHPLSVDDDSDSDSDGEGEMAPEPSFSATASVSLAEEGFFERLDKMSSDLDGLVRFIRRGVESLAAGVGDSGQVFGVLAFSLEDWDR
ncbi:hypothetical protein OE88DRAFT_1764883 [Heliocybe sulcata]|uniref:Spindle pole body component n=1 Tax=Heliocybe sulcata TaxID=5364 RepID=A0A5C3NDJ2_9AGAM|nr:hypothetical protein OE88DRAFT_1764883 [Heliocybe sulcata]